MAPLVSSIEIARPQEEVFAYVTDPSTFCEWQAGVVGGNMEGGEAPDVSSKCMTTRRTSRTERAVTSEITKIEPPASRKRRAHIDSLLVRVGSRWWQRPDPSAHPKRERSRR